MAHTGLSLSADPVMETDELLKLQGLVNRVYVDPKIQQYAVDIVLATREPAKAGLSDYEGLIQYGASPRASIALVLAARAQALMNGRAFVTPRDIKQVGLDVLRHRVIVSYEAEAEEITSDRMVRRIFDTIEVP
jgi:MoxR-like ATPase